MNKVYRTIWNESLGAWVATSEVGKARGKRSRNRVALAVAAALLGGATSVQAAPDGSDSGVTTGPGGIAFSSGAIGTPARSWPGGIAIGAGAFTDSSNDNTAVMAVNNGGIAIGNGASTGTNNGNRQIALGAGAQAFGSDSLAIGTFARIEVGTTGAMAFGTRATALATNSVAIGFEAVTSGTNAVALGASTNAAVSAVAVGDHAVANGAYDIYVGAEAGKGGLAANSSNVGMGYQAGQAVDGSQNTAAGGLSGSNVVGTGNTGLGFSAGRTVNGSNNATVGVYSGSDVAGSLNANFGPGSGNNVKGSNNFSAGSSSGTDVTGSRNVAMGFGAGKTITADATISIGSSAKASSSNAIAIGSSAIATGMNDVYIGTGAGTGGVAGNNNNSNVGIGLTAGKNVDGRFNIAMGNTAGTDVIGTANTGLGDRAGLSVTGNDNTTVGVLSGSDVVGAANTNVGSGSGNFVNGTNNFSAGHNSGTHVTGNSNIAMGENAGQNVTAAATISIGLGANASKNKAIAMGANTVASAASAIAIGDGAQATGVQSISVGTGNIVSGSNSGAFGDPNIINGSGSYAMGNNNTINANDAFVLGNNVNVATGLDGAVVLGNNSTVAASSPTASTSINGTTYNFAGAAPAAGGVVSVGAAGAERQISNVAAGRIGGASTDAVNGSQLHASNVAIDNLATTVAANRINYYSVNSAGGGNQLNDGATAVDAIAVGKDASASVSGGLALGAGSVSDRAIAPVNGNIPVGSTAITYNTTDKTLLGAVSVGNATAYRQVTNVADGTEMHDAVTVRQLSGALQAFAATPTAYFHTNSTAPDSLAVGAESVAVGPRTVVNGNNGIGIGNGAVVHLTAPGGIALGQGATSHLADSIALGTGSSSAAVQGIALGAGASVTQAGGVALGAGSVSDVAVGTAGVMIGGNAYNFAGTAPSSTVSVGAIGAERTITNVAAGRISASSTDAVNGSQLFATNTAVDDLSTRIAISEDSFSNIVGDTSVAYTDANGVGIRYARTNEVGLTKLDSHALGQGSTAVGYDAKASAPNALALGRGAVAGQEGSVALGFGSVTDVAVGTDSIAIGGKTYNFAGTTPASTVSVGALGAERTITNVAAGRVSASSTDAVNGSQLYASNQAIDNLATTVDANKIGYYSVNSTGGGNQLNDGATGANAIAVGKDASASVSGALALGAGSVSDRAIAPISGNIPVGSTAITYNTTDKTLLGAVSVGNATAYRQVTNVADGTQMQDAVTVRQLSGALQAFAATPTAYFHTNSTAPDSLAVGAESVAVGPRTVVNGNNGIGIGNGAVVHLTAPGGIALGQGATSHLADSIALGTGSSSAAVQGVALGAGTSVTQAGGVALGSGAVASTAAGVTGYLPTGATVGQTASIIATTSTQAAVSVGDAAHGQFRQITGVAAGTQNSDAVNVAQLKATQSSIVGLDQTAVKYDKNGDGTTNYNSITMGGGAGGSAPVAIHNVANGTAPTDAVNVRQLGDALAEGKQYTDTRIDQLQGSMVGVREDANAGAAGAMAMAGMPQAAIPGRGMIAVGMAGYRGQGALSIGVSALSDNGRWIYKLQSSADSRRHVGVAAGVGFHW